MQRRFVSIWFRYLKTDWLSVRRPALRSLPFVLAAPDHGRMVITAVNPVASEHGIEEGTVLADARTIDPSLQHFDDRAELSLKILNAIARWCVRFSPNVSIDLPDGLIVDASGCTHLWQGDEFYLQEIKTRCNKLGYHVKLAMADTIGAAWA